MGRKPLWQKKLDKIVFGVLIYDLLFVITAWVTYWVKDSLPDVLVTVGLGGGLFELVLTAWIKVNEDKSKRRDKDGQADE